MSRAGEGPDEEDVLEEVLGLCFQNEEALDTQNDGDSKRKCRTFGTSPDGRPYQELCAVETTGTQWKSYGTVIKPWCF